MQLKHLVYRFTHEFNGGVTALSSLMGKNEKVMQLKINPNNTTHFVTVDELDMLADLSGSNGLLADYFAAKADAVVYALPTVNDMDEEAVLDSFLNIGKQLGTLSSDFQKAYADGDIKANELRQLEDDITQGLKALLVLKATLNRISE